jgi:hypothetical protein
VSVTDKASATVTQVNNRNALGRAEVCSRCFRGLEPDEPVWMMHSGRFNYAAVCADCTAFELRWHKVDDGVWAEGDFYLFYWFEGACETCSRTVFKKARYHRQHFFCGRGCEGAYWSRRRRKRVSEKTCEVCDEPFTAKRAGAKTCSPACKQKAYRTRKKIEKEAT